MSEHRIPTAPGAADPTTRRGVLGLAAAAAALAPVPGRTQPPPAVPGLAAGAARGPRAGDRVFLCNEDSNTLSMIDPVTDTVAGTVNLTSFDEDPRAPFRFATGGIVPSHGAMVQKPLYRGAISVHGSCPSPDSRLLAVTGRGSSNVYLIDVASLRAVGNRPNPFAGEVNPERLTGGVFIGREPHEPTFTRDGRQLWVAMRGEDRIAVLDVRDAMRESAGEVPRGTALRALVPTVEGPSQVWFSADGATAFVASQKVPRIDVLAVGIDADGEQRATRRGLLDISAQDRFGFSPFLKLSPDGAEMWVSHKLADRVSALDVAGEPRVLDTVELGALARPNHVEFVENDHGRAVYVSLARVDDSGPGGVASSRIAVVDRAAPAGRRKVVGQFFSHGREAHGMWTDPSGTRLYVAHEQDELPGTAESGQTVCTVFDVSDPFAPRHLARIPLGDLMLPSGRLRNKKSINLVYVRPGMPSATGLLG